MFNRFVGAVVLSVALGAAATAQIVVNSATKDGDTIKGQHRFRVTVQSQSLVSQVEFYVKGNLVATDESTPYEYTIDTLGFDDGPLAVVVAAYNADGNSQRTTLNLTVDNGLAKGVAFHVGVAEGLLIEQQWDQAIQAGRVALKINGTDNSARSVMARAYFGKGIYDLAQKFAEDVVESDPSNVAARELLSGISLRQAFRAMTTSSDRDQTLTIVSSALRSAASSRRSALSAMIENFGVVTPENRMSYTDMLMEAGRFSLVIDQLAPVFNIDERDSQLANRLAYAQLRAGRYAEARTTMTRHVRRGDPDAYGFALKAVIDDWFGDAQGSANAEREALLYDPSDLGVRTAQAFLALRRGNNATFASIATNVAQSTSASPITNYYLSAMYYLQAQFDNSDNAFQAGLLADPAMYHLYIERFNQSVSFYFSSNPSGDDKSYQIAFAKSFAEGALEAKPESFEALTALALINFIDGKLDDAIRLGQAAVAAGPQYGAAHYTLAGAYFARNMSLEGQKAMVEAAKYDKHLDGIRAPKVEEAWRYFYRYGRTPLLTPPTRPSGN